MRGSGFSPGLILAALAALAACSPAERLGESNALHRGLGTAPETLDAQKARSVQASDVLRDLGEGLVTHAPDGSLEPGTAERWTVSDDGLAWTFSLRGDARWSNGEPLTADHFVLGLRRLVDPAVAAFYAQSVADLVNAKAIIAGDRAPATLGVEAADERTLVIRLERPVPWLAHLLAHPSTYPAYPTADGVATAAEVSNGAYRLASHDAGALLAIVRNEHYWNDANTAIDTVFHHVLTEELSELNRYRAGELHVTGNVPPEQFDSVRREYGDQLRVAPYLGVYYYGFNLTAPPFAGYPELRQALSMAIDRDVIVERITGRGETAALSFVPPGISNYDPPQLSYAGLTQAERNAIAQRLFRAAGYGPDVPLEIELRYNRSDTQERIAVAVQAMWQEVLGVETRLIGEEFQVLLANIRDRRETQVFRASWIADYNDAASFLGIMQSGHSSNLPGYGNDAYDALLERAAGQADPGRRRLYLEEAERVLLADHALIPLYFYVSKHLVRPEVGGWQDNVLDYHYSRHLSLDRAP